MGEAEGIGPEGGLGSSGAAGQRRSGRAPRRAIISRMESHAHVKLSGDRAGDYVVTEERSDGSLTLVPDTSFEAIRRRLGTEPATLAEFEAEYGPVGPPDGEG